MSKILNTSDYGKGYDQGFNDGKSEGYDEGFEACLNQYEPRIAKLRAEFQMMAARVAVLERKLS